MSGIRLNCSALCALLLVNCSADHLRARCADDAMYVSAASALLDAENMIAKGAYQEALLVLDAAPLEVGRIPEMKETVVMDDSGLKWASADDAQRRGNFSAAATTKCGVLSSRIARHERYNCRK